MPHPKFFPQAITQFFIPFVTSFLITGFIACNNDKKEEDKSIGNVSSDSGFQMNCVILERSQVQAWVDSGWTTSQDQNSIKGLVFQFYTNDAEAANNNMQLVVYPGESFTNVKTNGRAILKIDTTCSPLTLSGPVIFANNVIYISALDILNTDGSLKDFDFIRLTPSTTKYNPYINFSVEIVKTGTPPRLLSGDGTDPCPPVCPPPPPPPPPPLDK